MTNFRDLPPISPASRARRDIDLAIAQTMARQGGAIADHQLAEIGVRTRAVSSRIRAGRLFEADVGRGIYSATPEPLRGRGRQFAALLWAPKDSCLADTTAASVADLERHRGSLVHVLLVGDRRARPTRGVKIHRTTSLPAADVTTFDQFRCSAPARTILDIALGGDQQRIDALVDRAVGIGLYDHVAMGRVQRDRPTHPGCRLLAAAIAKLDDNAGRHRSDFEILTTNLIKTAPDLPTPVVNCLLAGFEPDLHLPGTRVIIELDSRAYHRTPAQLARDALKREILTALGYRFLLLRWEQVAYRPEEALQRIRTFYAANKQPPVPTDSRLAA